MTCTACVEFELMQPNYLCRTNDNATDVVGWAMLARILFFVACFFTIGDGAALAADEAFAEIYAELSLRMPTPTLVVVCHAFGCSNQAHIILSPGDRARLSTLLAAGKASPANERRALAGAVQWFERRIGPVAGTTGRVARAGAAESHDPGQMDCIDLSANNTSLLLLLTQLQAAAPPPAGTAGVARLPGRRAVAAHDRGYERAQGRPTLGGRQLDPQIRRAAGDHAARRVAACALNGGASPKARRPHKAGVATDREAVLA